MLSSFSSRAIARKSVQTVKHSIKKICSSHSHRSVCTTSERLKDTMSSASIDQGDVCGPVQASMQMKLSTHFSSLTHLEVINESHKHNVPKGSESHFKVVIVSDMFEGKAIIERHRMVNSALSEELKQSIHALSIQGTSTYSLPFPFTQKYISTIYPHPPCCTSAKTSNQWANDPSLTTTPNCQGGSKK